MARFVKGQSGNPGGQPKARKDVQALAQQHGPDAIEALVRGLSDPKQYVHAAVALLDRGFGRPAQSVELGGSLNVNGGIDAPPRPATVEDAEAWLARRRKELAELH